MSSLFTPVTPVLAEHPFRDRRGLGHSWVRFEARSGFSILVDPFVQAWLVSRAERSAPAETFGLLLGRTFGDGQGPFVVVERAVQVPSDVGTAACVVVDGLEVHELRCCAATLYPCLDVVGWWHTHSVCSGFSDTDRDEQRTWGRDQIGVVVFMQPGDGPWAFAYRGPHSEVVDLVDDDDPPAGRERSPQPAQPDAYRPGLVAAPRVGFGHRERLAPGTVLPDVATSIETDADEAEPHAPTATPPIGLALLVAFVVVGLVCAIAASAVWAWSR